MQTWETEKKTFFDILWSETKYIFPKNSTFYFHCTFYFQFCGRSVGLSLIWIIQCKSDAFWYRPENRKNPPSFDVLRPKTQFSFRKNCLFFVWIPCASNKAANLWLWETLVWHSKIRIVLVRDRKPQRTHFWDFWFKTQFFCVKLPFSFLVYLVRSSGQQLSC